MDPLELTLTELVDALRRREISAVDVMEATLARADATHEQLNAFVACRDRSELVDEARAADARIAEGGLARDPRRAVRGRRRVNTVTPRNIFNP